jgi:threonine/homoserine/homoserine lactone efflux protein
MVLVFFLKGIAVGIVIAVPVGPVGILCLRKFIFEGELAGLVAGLGAASGDTVFGIMAAFGLTFIAQELLGYQGPLRVAGGCYLLYAGARALLRPPPDEANQHHDPETLLRSFFSTFALTITNPITVLAFLGIFAALGLGGARATWLSAGLLVAGVWTGSLLWWLSLSLGIGMFRRAIGPRHLALISRGSGAVLFLSGAALLATTAVKYLEQFL